MDISSIIAHVESILATLDALAKRVEVLEQAAAPAAEPAPAAEGSVPQAGVHE